jgi:hypothetical protein
MIGKALTPNQFCQAAMPPADSRGFIQQNFQPDSIRPDAAALKAGFEDETPQLAFGTSTPHQSPEDSACDERV